jgi:hypothetical protein
MNRNYFPGNTSLLEELDSRSSFQLDLDEYYLINYFN